MASNPSQAERQRQAIRPGLAVRGTFSPARAWRPAVVARLARTLEVSIVGSVDLSYTGNAAVKSKVAGSGSVNKR